MKIKLKVKTLILFSLGFLLMVFVLLPKGNIIIARALNHMDSPYAEAFYERYLDQNFGNPSFSARVEYAESLIDGFHRYGRFNSFSGGGSNNRPEDMEKAKTLIIEGLNRQKNLENHEVIYIEAYRLLMDLLIATGDAEGFNSWLNMEVGESKEFQELQLVYEAYFQIYFGDMKRAKVLLEEEIDPDYYQREQQVLLAEIALRDGDLESAEEHITQARALYAEDSKALERSVFGTGAFSNQKYWMNNYRKDISGDFTLSGRVVFEGEPMPFVEIYVKSGLDSGWSSRGERFVAITDEGGYFETIGLRRGSYDVGIGIDTSRIHDKYYVQNQGDLAKGYLLLEEDHYMELSFIEPIQFNDVKDRYTVTEEEEFNLSWESVPGAAYYQVQFLSFSNPMEKSGSHTQRPLITSDGEEKITENQGNFTVSSINQKIIGGIVTYGDEDMLLGSTAVLRPILPGVEYPMIIKAFDEAGQEITSSLALRGDYNEVPSFTLEGELTEGEELILNEDYPEAITFYKDHLHDEEIREEALRTLSLLYHYGWKRGEEDPSLALSFAKEYFEETGHSQNLEMIIGRLSLEELEKNRNKIENLIQEIEEPEEPYSIQQVRANLYLIDRDWESALTVYEENEDALSSKVLYLDLLLGDYQRASKRLRDSRFHIYRMDPLRTEEALQALSEEGLSFADETRLEKLMEALLIESRDSAEEVYREILPDVESKALRDLLYEIHLNNNWDRDW
ncbi:hypothetical protein [Isachenkonia alkalipeptolytica]|uniref:Tetratricopeptide repeat protein n=1 Tax=Isachenkonia alkalipeptolytica TaxID=2565777 RepID=A0AA44BE79_9CLOT|nr:hypothetical protein [Isachenkonia alkalipeptolytica]NBG87191.1 hypothetical protein [Isachenkonia alkalipeptolytica]